MDYMYLALAHNLGITQNQFELLSSLLLLSISSNQSSPNFTADVTTFDSFLKLTTNLPLDEDMERSRRVHSLCWRLALGTKSKVLVPFSFAIRSKAFSYQLRKMLSLPFHIIVTISHASNTINLINNCMKQTNPIFYHSFNL